MLKTKKTQEVTWQEKGRGVKNQTAVLQGFYDPDEEDKKEPTQKQWGVFSYLGPCLRRCWHRG